MARTPFRYSKQGDEWAIDADSTAVVQRIFAEFTRPYFHAGLTEIAAGLNAEHAFYLLTLSPVPSTNITYL